MLTKLNIGALKPYIYSIDGNGTVYWANRMSINNTVTVTNHDELALADNNAYLN